MTAEEKSVLSLFMIGVLIVVGKVLAGGEPITPRLFIGRMLLGGFVSMVAGVVLVQFPDLSLPAVCGIGSMLGIAGYLIEVREWWQLNEEPGTFRIVVGVLEQGITEEMYQELERLVADAKPASRHLTGLAISLSTTGNIFAGAGCYHGDALTVYPYTPEAIIVGGDYFPASAIHLIDNLRVNA